MAAQENRDMKRGSMEVKVRYRTSDKTFHGFTENVSTGGVFIVTDNPLPIGEVVELDFTVPSNNVQINTAAKVCWIRKFDPEHEELMPGMGLRFLPKECIPGREKNSDDENESEFGQIIQKDDQEQSFGRVIQAEEEEASFGAVIQTSDDDEETFKTKAEDIVEDASDLDVEASSIKLPSIAQESSYDSTQVGDSDIQGGEQEIVDEKRQQLRIKIHVQIDLASSNNFYIGQTENISAGGVFVATRDPLPIGAGIELAFDLPNCKERIKVAGEVRWASDAEHMDQSGKPGMGVQFLELTAMQKQYIDYFIKSIREPYYFPESDEDI